jgi:hypothetical protein
MFHIHFDSNDSFIYRGQDFYYNNLDDFYKDLKEKVGTQEMLDEVNNTTGMGYRNIDEMIREEILDPYSNWFYVEKIEETRLKN